MATALVLHVIAIGVVLNRFPLRWYTILGCFLYFWGFYVGVGNYIKTHREKITPTMPLEDDYWNYYQPMKKSPFDQPDSESTKETEEQREDDIRDQKRRYEENKAYPSTKP